MPHANEVGERAQTHAETRGTLLSELIGGASPSFLAAVSSGPVRLDVAQTRVRRQTSETVALHEWIPMGSINVRNECRCCHCGVVRSYELAADVQVSYSRYGHRLSKGPLGATGAPACVP